MDPLRGAAAVRGLCLSQCTCLIGLQRRAVTGFVFRLTQDVPSTLTTKSSSDVEEDVLKDEIENALRDDNTGEQKGVSAW